MDNSPGYWTIYMATGTAHIGAIACPQRARPGAALAVAPDDTLFLAWQDRVPEVDNHGTFDIFLSERSEASWTLPVNISDRPSVDSIGAHLATRRMDLPI